MDSRIVAHELTAIARVLVGARRWVPGDVDWRDYKMSQKYELWDTGRKKGETNNPEEIWLHLQGGTYADTYPEFTSADRKRWEGWLDASGARKYSKSGGRWTGD